MKKKRCEIVDVGGMNYKVGPYTAATPVDSRPHVGKKGYAERDPQGIKIILDDGTVLYGYECWWKAIE